MEGVAHILPTTPPEFNGLGDYCYRLWQNWPTPNPDWHILALNLPPGAEAAWPGVTLHEFGSVENLDTALIRAGAKVAVLHYVPFAFHPRGIPYRLPGALHRWKAETGGKLFVVFHEFYATGKFWTITGAITPLAKKIVRQLAREADGWVTSCEPFFERAVKVGRADPSIGSILPVGSNITPTAGKVEPRKLSANSPLSVVAFGLAGTRLRAMREHREFLSSLHQGGLLSRLLLLGAAPNAELDAAINQIIGEIGIAGLVDREYDLSSEEISARLLTQDLALIRTPQSMRGKSGVYAACVVHGLRCAFPGERSLEQILEQTELTMDWQTIASEFNRLIETLRSS